MKNIFIIHRGLSSEIINSQMLEIINNINKIYIIETLPVCHISDDKKITQKKEMFNSLVWYLINKNDVNYIYTRSVFEFISIYFIKKIFFKKWNIIFDFRGMISEESYLRHKNKYKRYMLRGLEFFAYKYADRIHTVSYSFKNYLIHGFGEKNIKVYPCAINTSLLKVKEDKKILNFIYLGSISSWQKFDETINLYKYIEQQIGNTKLTVITRQKKEAEKIIYDYNLKNIEIKSLTHEKVLEDLKNYDFGFLLRDNITVNNVASPIKFLEYISNGIIPIMTKGIGDYSDIARGFKIGVIVEDGLSCEIAKLNEILEDKGIYSRMNNISSKYIWGNILKGFYD